MWLFLSIFLALFIIIFGIQRIQRRSYYFHYKTSSWEYRFLGRFSSYGIKWLRSIEQIIALIEIYSNAFLNFFNQENQEENTRKILRKKIKVIDDEELVFAF